MSVLLAIKRKPYIIKKIIRSLTLTLGHSFKPHITFGQFSQRGENVIRRNFMNFNILFFNGLVHLN